MRVIKKLISVVITLCIMLSCVQMLSACTSGGNSGYEWVRRDPILREETDYGSYLSLPKASAPKNEISYIDVTSYENDEIFLAVATQGVLNGNNPFVYVIADPMIEGNMNASQFWFEKLDETYPDTYEKVEYTDIYRLIMDNIESVDGYILYDERLTDDKMRSRNHYRELYGDMALLDLTIMLCGIYDSIPLTREQLYVLRENYGFNLTKKGDTTQFMIKDGEGNIDDSPAARKSLDVWYNVFNYVLRELGPSLNDNVFAHNPAFQIPSADYWIQNDMMVYTRVFAQDATAREIEMEKNLLALTKTNASSVGCFYLQSDEANYMSVLSVNGKNLVCTYETYNISWTSGLESVYPKEPVDRDLQVEEGKIYISFDLTEGDNNSYHYFRMPQIVGEDSADDIMGWAISPTLGEISPNMLAYFNSRFGDVFGIVTPEAGFGYVNRKLPDGTAYDFHKITEEYLSRTGSDSIRVIDMDYQSYMSYAENIDGLESLLFGYMGEGETYWNNNEDANFLYNDTVFFRHYDGRAMGEISKYNSATPAFFAVSLYGWNQTASSIKSIMKNLDERFVLVTPSELADLYKQYYAGRYNDVTEASFCADFSKEELGFLNYASNHSSIDQSKGERYVDARDYLKYRFDLRDDVQKAEISVTLSGRYQLEVSSDGLNWAIIDKANKYYEEDVVVKRDVSFLLGADNPSNTVYLRVGDATVDDNNGAVLKDVAVKTDKSVVSNLHLTKRNDSLHIIDDNSEVKTDGRSGKFTYAFNPDTSVDNLTLSVDIKNSMTVRISKDNKDYRDLVFDGVLGTTGYADISKYLKDNEAGTLYVQFEGKGQLKEFKLTSIDPVSSLSFSPNGSSVDEKYNLSLDDYKLTGVNTTTSCTTLNDNEALLYKFIIGEGVVSTRLDLNIKGLYTVEASNDGKNFAKIVEAEIGGGLQNPYVYTDISQYATAGKTLYLKIYVTPNDNDKNVRLYGLRLYTNLAPESMKQMYELERDADFSFAPKWNGNNLNGDKNYGEEDVDSLEYKLIEKSMSSKYGIYMHNYVQPLRSLSDPSGYFVYKLDFNDLDFWREAYPKIFVDGFEIERLRVDVEIAEGYIALSDNDGEEWSKILDCGLDNTYRGGAANRNVESMRLDEYLCDKPIYIKFADNTPENGWGTLIYNISIYFN